MLVFVWALGILACGSEKQLNIPQLGQSPANHRGVSKPRPLAPAKVRGLFWRVEGKLGQAFVLGAIPVLDHKFFPLDPAIERAFAQSDTLVLELHVADSERQVAAEKLVAAARYAPPDTLRSHLSSDAWAKLHGALPTAVEREALTAFRPWFIALNLEQGELNALGADLSLEAYFVEKTRSAKLLSLLTVEDQVAMFQALSDSASEQRLVGVLDRLPILSQSLRRVEGAWHSGQGNLVGEELTLSIRRTAPEVFEHLWAKRQRQVTTGLIHLLEKQKNLFVVVDAALLVGQRSVLEQLAEVGFGVTQL